MIFCIYTQEQVAKANNSSRHAKISFFASRYFGSMSYYSGDDEPSVRRQPGHFSVLYVDLQRIQDRSTLRDRHLTHVSLGLPNSTNKKLANETTELVKSASAQLERRLSIISYSDSIGEEPVDESSTSESESEAEAKEKAKLKPVKYNRLDDRLRFANTLISANSADIIVIDSWPEECLMKNTFPALDNRNCEEESYVTKTAFRPSGGRGTMIAMKKRCLVPENERFKSVGLISLERLVRRNWSPTPLSMGCCNQSWIHAVDAGPAVYSSRMQPIRLVIVGYDCGKGYPFLNNNNSVPDNNNLLPKAFTLRKFLSNRSSSLNSPMLTRRSLRPAGVKSAVGAYEVKTEHIKRLSRSNSLKDNGNGDQKPGHTWWRGATTGPLNSSNETVIEGSVSNGPPPQQRERKNSLMECRQITPMEEAEERIRVASELKQLKSFISVTLANQVTEKRRQVEKRASETNTDNSYTQGTNGAVALVIGRFGINSLPLSQSMTSCSNSTMLNQECHVNVCDNDRNETLAAIWWHNKNSNRDGHNNSNDSLEPLQSSCSSDDITTPNEPIIINDATALLKYNKSEWMEAEFECRPRMFAVSFH